MISKSPSPTLPPRKCRPAPAISTTAAVVSSGERGTWPFLRASSRRFCVGRSVRSLSSSAMASGSAAEKRPHEDEGVAEQLDEARLQRRQPHEHDDEPEHERDEEADR